MCKSYQYNWEKLDLHNIRIDININNFNYYIDSTLLSTRINIKNESGFCLLFHGVPCGCAWMDIVRENGNINKVCVSKDPSVGTLKYGTTSRLANRCVKAGCSPGLISLAGCGKVGVRPPCILGKVDLSKDYPDCCPRPIQHYSVQERTPKMKVAFFFYFMVYLAVVYGWTSIEEVPEDDVNKVCVSTDPSVGTLKYGTTSRLANSCVRAKCTPGRISLAGCGVTSVMPPCTIGKEDLSKEYPACCPGPVCP
ncbi:hypothetical protein FQA39_LY04585 [Lamprigera yunnana]|nr:hypothetical protein FQA39_LY04585 [Lamprigera yunnana]